MSSRPQEATRDLTIGSRLTSEVQSQSTRFISLKALFRTYPISLLVKRMTSKSESALIPTGRIRLIIYCVPRFLPVTTLVGFCVTQVCPAGTCISSARKTVPPKLRLVALLPLMLMVIQSGSKITLFCKCMRLWPTSSILSKIRLS